MTKQITLLLWLSVNINVVILFFVGAFIIAQKTHKFYLVSKIMRKFQFKVKDNPKNYPPYYWHKKSQFEKSPTSSFDIIMLGDSITDEGEWSELLSNINIKNRGISGDTIERILYRLDTILATPPKQIFLMVGINDLVNSGKSITETLESYHKILNEFYNKTPNTEIFIQSLLPVNNNVYQYWQDNNNILKLNSGLQELAKNFNYQYIDLFSQFLDSENQLDAKYTVDGLHLNGQAYLIWKSVLEKYVASCVIPANL